MITDHIRNSYSIRVPSPDGEVFVHCTESESGNLEQVTVNIGKSGTTNASWADAFARMITFALRSTSLHEILEELSGNSSSRSIFSARHLGVNSSVDAVFRALLMYSNIKASSKKVTYRPPAMTIPAGW